MMVGLLILRVNAIATALVLLLLLPRLLKLLLQLMVLLLTTPAAHHRPSPRTTSLLEFVLALLGAIWGIFSGLFEAFRGF